MKPSLSPETSPNNGREVISRLSMMEVSLQSLPLTRLEELAKAVEHERITSEVALLVEIAKIKVGSEIQLWLAGYSDSLETQRTYKNCIWKLITWCQGAEVHPLLINGPRAGAFVGWLGKQTRSISSINRIISGVSSWYSWMHRRHAWLDNPFRGGGLREVDGQEKKPLWYPTVEEIAVIEREIPAADWAAVSVLAFRGLRVGALPRLALLGGRFRTWSKGKEITGSMPDVAIRAIRRADLDPAHPFSDRSGPGWSSRLAYLFQSLYVEGKVNHSYSAHKLRHYFAVCEYQKDFNLYRLKDLLGHTSIAVTQRYLKGLDQLK